MKKLSNIYIGLILFFLFAPIAVMIFFSFNAGKSTAVFSVDTLNGWARNMCAEQGARYLASNLALKDDRGYLKSEYQIGDGYHLSTAAYEKMLYYIRTHAVK